jgi:hypothetical protein
VLQGAPRAKTDGRDKLHLMSPQEFQLTEFTCVNQETSAKEPMSPESELA